ncbi:MAG: protein-L-isoaspartate(D-aspartate) O-methyltransferase [Alphaproteobacteria bacterium]|nr:protein-L-isoaspartate(D-aspartate) O-methyltransferase [Alphaproteobacteria bacterium]
MTAAEGEEDRFAIPRRRMVEEIALHARHVSGKTGRAAIFGPVMEAIGQVPRHTFVPVEMALYAYLDAPLPIGCGKTISQPFIVALMTDLLEIGPDHRVLEIGTGLGYQAAVLAELAAEVFTVEVLEELAQSARRRLADRGYANVHSRIGDGSMGWPEHAPFDRIIATAAPDLIPPALLQQLKPGGRMMIPAGLEDDQRLLLVTKDAGGRIGTEEVLPVRFSRMTSGTEAADARG